MSPLPFGGCSIDVGPLVEIAPLKCAWIKHTPTAPLVILASDKAKYLPKSAMLFDSNKKLKSLEVIISHNHPNKDYDVDVKLEPIY